MAPKVNTISVQVFHISAVCGTLLVAFIYLFVLDNLNGIGKMWLSPTVGLIIVAELLKAVVNSKMFHLDHNIKDSLTKKIRKTASPWCVASLAKMLTACIAVSMMFAFICIILGAPVLTDHEATGSLALLLTSLTFLPMILLLGIDNTVRLLLWESFELSSGLEGCYWHMLKRNGMGVILGAWGGSIVAPLDWDRSWQIYPIPNMIGGLLGYSLANAVTVAEFFICLNKQKLLKFNVP